MLLYLYMKSNMDVNVKKNNPGCMTTSFPLGSRPLQGPQQPQLCSSQARPLCRAGLGLIGGPISASSLRWYLLRVSSEEMACDWSLWLRQVSTGIVKDSLRMPPNPVPSVYQELTQKPSLLISKEFLRARQAFSSHCHRWGFCR